MEFLSLLNGNLTMPLLALLVIAVYIITRYRNNKKYKR